MSRFVAYTVSLTELRRAGLVLTADEVVAIAEKLIHQPPDDVPRPPFGPLAAERICISSDGAVRCAGCAATPTVAELAIVMQDLLAESPHVPGALRYAIARALHEVDAPPFDSLAEFGATLARYAPKHPEDTLRRLIAKRDRRRPAASTSDLRLELREADRRLFEARVHGDPPPVSDTRARGWMVGLLVAGALTTIAAASVVGDRTLSIPQVPPPPAAADASILAPPADTDLHAVIASPSPRPVHAHSKRVVRDVHARMIRFRLFHKTIAIRDDLTRP